MASISQRVIFTIIPDGFAGDRARLNLHIAPRLSLEAGVFPADLSQFGAWTDWADTINNARLTLLVDGSPVATRRMAKADPQIWAALLPPTTPVQTHRFEDFRGVDVLTYPLAELAAAIEADYLNLAGDADEELPKVGELRKKIGYPVSREFDRSGLIALLRTANDTRTTGRRDVAIALLAEYHRPLTAETLFKTEKLGPDDPHEPATYIAAKRLPMPDAAALAKQFDFHRIVSALGQHPALMTACGLVIPLEMRLDALPIGNCELAVAVDWDTHGTETEADVCPVTLARRDARDFRARPKLPATLDGGWLRLDPARFNLVTMDADGAGLSLKNFTINLPNIADERFDDSDFTHEAPARAGTPRLRTAGIQLAQSRRDRAIRGLFAGSGSLNDAMVATGQLKLHAEDIIRGWRADVQDDRTGRWQSLLRFDGHYALLNSGRAHDTVDEEATLRLGATKAADGSNDKLLKASEALFAWSGWSLAAPQPGRVIMPDDISHEDAPNTVPDGLPLQVTPRATRGSLPVLRFGRSYRVRMRYADLAGGGVRWSPDDVAGSQIASRPMFFGRYEPVEAPGLTLLNGDALPKDGESMARAALRTMTDAPNDTQARRNIVPPRVGIRFAEFHGVLDRGGRPAPDAYQLLVDRDANYPQVEVLTAAFHPAGAPGDPATVRTSFAVADHADQTPYLYDPLAAGAALRISGVPGINPEKIWRVPFAGDVFDADAPTHWPDARGFSLLASETGVTGWDAPTRTFRVVLGPGERARIRVSALVPKRGLALFKLLDGLRLRADADPNGEAPQIYAAARALAAAGKHWMFTPWRVVELVHALQRPLVPPQFLSLFAHRQRGDVTAQISWGTPLHCKSTVRIDMAAAWLEIEDQGAAGPSVRTIATDAFRQPFARLDFANGVVKRQNNDQVFADTRARRVSFEMTATTRFREFMPAAIRDDAGLLVHVSPRQDVWVPSSSPPPAPVIRYLVPTFGWSVASNGATKRNWRSGGGIRVYLDRPWFGSGSNEMLAVLLPTVSNFADDNGPQKDFITQWGADPIWAGATVHSIAPARTAFARRIDKGPVPYEFGDGVVPNPAAADGAAAGENWPMANLRPPGAPDGLFVHAVPHAVGYDPTRALWYCDIVVRPGEAYFPFIRLALARYQPHSIGGCELSSVAMAAFQQLAPDRVATVTPVDGSFQERGRRIAVYGILPARGFVRPSAGHIRVRLQRLVAGGDPDLDWRDTPQGPVPVPDPQARQQQPERVSRAFNMVRSRLTAEQKIMVKTGDKLLDAGDYTAVLANPLLTELMLPPLIHEETVQLPLPDGDRLRLLVTETELYSTERPEGGRALESRERIVYAAAIAV